MERNDNYAIFENNEDIKLSFLHSFAFKLVLMGVILLIYGVLFCALFAGESLSRSNAMQAISDRQRDWYNGYSALTAVQMNLNNYLNAPSEEYREEMQETLHEIDAFTDLLTDEEAGIYAGELARLCGKYMEAIDETVASHDLGDSEQMLTSFESATKIQSLISDFSFYSMMEMEDQLAAGFASQNALLLTHLRNDALAMMIVTILIVAIAVLLFRCFLKPLYQLIALIRVTSTDTWTVQQPPDTRKDEIGLLIHAFYEMMNKICLQFDELNRKHQLEADLQKEHEKAIQAEALLAKSELKTFQSQINTHFLFNTINVISRLAYMEHASRVQNAIQLLAQFLRNVLDQFNETVTLGEEFENIENYVAIQNLRFGDRIQFESDLDFELEWFQLPSMTLQPLVENAYQHGVSNKKQGFIRCAAEQEGKDVLLYVWDDGAGLDREECAQLMKHLTEDSLEGNPEQCIGLVNVYRRLSLCYPGKVEPILEGEKGKFAKIGFRIKNPEKLNGKS